MPGVGGVLEPPLASDISVLHSLEAQQLVGVGVDPHRPMPQVRVARLLRPRLEGDAEGRPLPDLVALEQLVSVERLLVTLEEQHRRVGPEHVRGKVGTRHVDALAVALAERAVVLEPAVLASYVDVAVAAREAALVGADEVDPLVAREAQGLIAVERGDALEPSENFREGLLRGWFAVGRHGGHHEGHPAERSREIARKRALGAGGHGGILRGAGSVASFGGISTCLSAGAGSG